MSLVRNSMHPYIVGIHHLHVNKLFNLDEATPENQPQNNNVKNSMLSFMTQSEQTPIFIFS